MNMDPCIQIILPSLTTLPAIVAADKNMKQRHPCSLGTTKSSGVNAPIIAVNTTQHIKEARYRYL